MLEYKVKLVNQLGLHARAAAKLVRCAGQFQSRVVLINPLVNATANGKSILSLLVLAASFGVTLDLRIEGEDESDAGLAIIKLFADGFGEV